jgi:hypothetical protein
MALRIVPLQTNALGSATAKTPDPINGWVHSVRVEGAALGGTADFLITRDYGGTILSLTDQQAPFQFQPRETLHTSVGGSALAASSEGIPVEGYVTVQVTQAVANSLGTAFIYYREDLRT